MASWKQEDFVVKSQFNVLKAQIEQKLGKSIEQKQIAAETNLREATISRWMSPEPFERIDANVWITLWLWVTQWLDIDKGDMFAVEPLETEE
jgi:hypothetical protein